jgi:hypothetical protein
MEIPPFLGYYTILFIINQYPPWKDSRMADYICFVDNFIGASYNERKEMRDFYD